MKDSRQIASAIDLRVRQLAAQNLSDSALIDQMAGCMSDLQRLWNSTTYVQLGARYEENLGLVSYATVRENLSEALGTGVGVRAHIQQLPRRPDQLKQVMKALLRHGATVADFRWQLEVFINQSASGLRMIAPATDKLHFVRATRTCQAEPL
jgi:hypothetical protein